MPQFSYISIQKFFRHVLVFFQDRNTDVSLSASTQEHFQEEQPMSRARFQVSVNDLKVISSALLHFKKFLVKRKDLDRAEVVGEVDNRIYQLIIDLENQQYPHNKTQREVAV